MNIHEITGCDCVVMVVVEKGHGDLSSKPGWGFLHMM